MTVHVDPATRAVLGRAEMNGHVLRLKDRLDRRSYDKVRKVVEMVGGRWDSRAGVHLFDEVPAAEALEQVLLTGLVTDERQELGAFFTPPAIADQVVAAAMLEAGMEVLEPSAGRGALAAPALLMGCRVDCIEIDPRNVHILASTAYRRVIPADFLGEWPKPAYDRVLMNPPFARQHDISHVTHALRFLRPGGRLVAVMSGGVLFRTDRRTEALRRLIEAGAGDVAALPENSFRSAGTAVSTALVAIEATAALVRALAEA